MSKALNNDQKLGLGAVLLFLLLLFAFLFLVSLKMPEKEEKKVELIELDFSGSKSSGGSSEKAEETTKQESTPEKTTTPKPVKESVKTQKTESPVKKSTNTSSKTSEKSEPSPKSGSLFPGNSNGSGSGTSNGNGDGNSDGLGDGIDGPGAKGKIGTLGNRKRNLFTVRNKCGVEGTVMVEVMVDRTGKVVSAKALSSHAKTTGNDPCLIKDAEAEAKRVKYEAKPNGAELEKGIIPVTFVLE